MESYAIGAQRVRGNSLIPSCMVLRRGISGTDYCGKEALYVVSVPPFKEDPSEDSGMLCCRGCIEKAILIQVMEAPDRMFNPGQVLVGYVLSGVEQIPAIEGTNFS